MSIPRNEYPRPQLVRKDWLNLNGEWDFTVDDACNGKDLRYYEKESLCLVIKILHQNTRIKATDEHVLTEHRKHDIMIMLQMKTKSALFS